MSRPHHDVYKEYLNQRTIKSAVREQPSMIFFLVSSDSEGMGGKTYSFVNPRQKLLTQSSVKHLIVNSGLAVSVVDDPNFRKFCYDMDPNCTVPCRRLSLTASFLRCYENSKINCRSLLLRVRILHRLPTFGLTEGHMPV